MFDPAFESTYSIRDATDRVWLAGRFLSAKNTRDYEVLNSEFRGLFTYAVVGQGVDDVEGVCTLMHAACELFALGKSEEAPALEDLEKCGLRPVFTGIGPADAEAEDIADSFTLSYMQPVKGKYYSGWLDHASQTVNGRFPGFPLSMMPVGGYLRDDADSRPVSELNDVQTLRADCAHIAQQLISLHLADVATVCDENTLQPVQRAYSGVSSLWLGLIERLNAARAYRCEACGKPGVAYGERRRRRFCCDACKKWKNAHPDEMRAHWYYEQ